jgi:hypothetical protein
MLDLILPAFDLADVDQKPFALTAVTFVILAGVFTATNFVVVTFQVFHFAVSTFDFAAVV